MFVVSEEEAAASAPPSIRMGNSPPRSSCAGVSPASLTPRRRGNVPGRSPGGSRCACRPARRRGRAGDHARTDARRASVSPLLSYLGLERTGGAEVNKCAGHGAAPTYCFRIGVRSIMVRSIPNSDRNSIQPTTHSRQPLLPPDPQCCVTPVPAMTPPPVPRRSLTRPAHNPAQRLTVTDDCGDCPANPMSWSNYPACLLQDR
jgi:hypothetical protein